MIFIQKFIVKFNHQSTKSHAVNVAILDTFSGLKLNCVILSHYKIPYTTILHGRWLVQYLCHHWPVVHGLRPKKKTQLVWRCHQLLSSFLAKGNLPRVSRQSRCSLMIRLIMKWSLGAVHRSPGICLTAEESNVTIDPILNNLYWKAV